MPNSEPKLIQIPRPLWSLRTLALPCTAFLANFFKQGGFARLGDLHNRQWADLPRVRRGDPLVRRELRALLRKVAEHPECARLGPWVATDRLPGDWNIFFVPPRARSASPLELPLPVRLRDALQMRHIDTLGDLHGMPVSLLRHTPNFGRTSLRALLDVMTRIARGEFEPPRGAQTLRPAVLLPWLDRLIAQLPPRQHRILMARFGGAGQPRKTLDAVGQRFGLTRERVRQIQEIICHRLPRLGGPAFLDALRQLAKVLAAEGSPRSPQQVARWLEPLPASARFPSEFYARLLVRILRRLAPEAKPLRRRSSAASSGGPPATRSLLPA